MISQKNYILIGTTLHVADYLIHHQVYTDLKFMGQCNSYHIISISKDLGSHITK